MKFLLMLVLINPVDQSETVHLHSVHDSNLSCLGTKVSIKQDAVIKAYCAKDYLVKKEK